MSKWEEKRLEDIIDVNPPVKLKKGESYPFIDIDKVSPTRRSVTNEEVKVYDGQSSSKFCDGDTVFSRITPCLENRKIAKVSINGDAAFGSTEFYVFRAKKKKADARFTYYLTSSNAVVLPAINSMTGASGRQRADKRFIQRLKLNLPDLPTQERIADILSAYDDLIEVNNQRIEILEQSAKELFKEWFVYFRFPRHENVELENGIPRGWEKDSFEKIAIFQNGYAFKSNELLDYDVGNCYEVFKQGHIKRGGGFKVEGTKSWYPKSLCEKLSKYVLQQGDILMAMTDMKDNVAILGNTAVLPFSGRYVLNQRVGLLRPTFYRGIGFAYIHLLTNSYDFVQDLRSRANRGVQVNLSAVQIKASEILIAPKEVNIRFSELVTPMYETIFNLISQNEDLARQRDMLLPRLMSGNLEV